MTIDIVSLIAKTDKDGSGEIDFDEFCELLKSAKKRTAADEQEVLGGVLQHLQSHPPVGTAQEVDGALEGRDEHLRRTASVR